MAKKPERAVKDQASAHPPKRHDKVNRWTLEKELGKGGNGYVWQGIDKEGVRCAIKFLKKPREIPYKRFTDEVAALKLVAGVKGILPLLGSHLPVSLESSLPWYAMPIGTPLLNAAKGWKAEDKVQAIVQVAETMALLHSKGMAHRDIKPSNLLIYQERCHISDFGLVSYPKKTDITGKMEELGPRWTMAPEVRRFKSSADPIPADVYSLTKTLWIILTGNEMGFEGRYDPSGDLSIKKYCRDLYITSLEDLLSAGTENRPERRPSMQRFAERLQEWLRVSGEFPEHNPLQWAEVQKRLFPVTVPSHAEWNRIEDIISVLNILGETQSLNHLFFPDSGGLDLERAVESRREAGCIELLTGGVPNIVKPSRLSFESFGNDPEWNYFRLETESLAPSGVYDDIESRHSYEELTEVAGERYADRGCWDSKEFEGKRLPKGSRLVLRFFSRSIRDLSKDINLQPEPGHLRR